MCPNREALLYKFSLPPSRLGRDGGGEGGLRLGQATPPHPYPRRSQAEIAKIEKKGTKFEHVGLELELFQILNGYNILISQETRIIATDRHCSLTFSLLFRDL